MTTRPPPFRSPATECGRCLYTADLKMILFKAVQLALALPCRSRNTAYNNYALYKE
jgi:hypothetical protein